MRILRVIAVLTLILRVFHGTAAEPPAAQRPEGVREFSVKGVVKETSPDRKSLVIQHDAIENYMPAMTMPFRIHDPAGATNIHAGDEIDFRLRVGRDESWIDHIVVRGHSQAPPAAADSPHQTNATPRFYLTQIPRFAFTNEFGQPVRLDEFKGHAVALTFFFTRCPIPEFCPRLSRNFAEASQKLKSMTGAPTNWHFISISFDPFDTPQTLRAYAQQYSYDSNHWTFLTAPKEQLQELTRGFGLAVTPGAGGFSHDFRTAVFDATGRLQTLWPFGGNQTEFLVKEILKGAGVKKN